MESSPIAEFDTRRAAALAVEGRRVRGAHWRSQYGWGAFGGADAKAAP